MTAIRILTGDCREVMATLPEASVDAIVTDPPYLLNFMGKAWDRVAESIELDPGLGHWLAGFADGEGCFTTRKSGAGFVCEFVIHLRADDAAILRQVHEATGLGDVSGPADREDGSSPMVKWVVRRQADCAKLVAIFDAFPLRAKKARDFEIWRRAVEQWIAHEPGEDWAPLRELSAMLSSVKKYGSAFNRDQFFHYQWAREAFRVLKPGGHLLAFGGTRTYHRLASGIEDAGFEIRDQIGWLYGSGFPKSLDVSKAIDKAAGAAREVLAEGKAVKRMIPGADQNETGSWIKDNGREYVPIVTAAATDAAKQWEGWGTALKPAWEPLVLARKPLEGAVAANVLVYGTGALNIDACRVPADDGRPLRVLDAKQTDNNTYAGRMDGGSLAGGSKAVGETTLGRWPANIIHDGSDEVIAAFPETGLSSGGGMKRSGAGNNVFGKQSGHAHVETVGYGDAGSAARFFYCAKADADDRTDGLHMVTTRGRNHHPTVKPTDLMRYLCRLVTPPGGIVLDPFMGSGSTLKAAELEGFGAIGIEIDPAYVEIAKRRVAADAPLFASVEAP